MRLTEKVTDNMEGIQGVALDEAFVALLCRAVIGFIAEKAVGDSLIVRSCQKISANRPDLRNRRSTFPPSN